MYTRVANDVPDLYTALQAVCGSQPVLVNDPVWRSLYTHGVPLASSDPAEIEAQLSPHTASLVYNNTQTLNCQRLIYTVSQQLIKSKDKEGTPATANAVYVLRSILKNLTEQLMVEQLMMFIELPDGSPTALQPELSELYDGSLIDTLCRAALGIFTADPPKTPGSYLLQLEVAQLLLVMCSTQLYTPQARSLPSAHPFVEGLMRQTDIAPPASIEALLNLFIANDPAPTSLKLFAPAQPRSVLRIVRSAVGSVLWLPYTAYTLLLRRNSSSGSGSDGPLADASLVLLLALAFFPVPQGVAWINPYRLGLQKLQDSDEVFTDAAAEGGMGGGKITGVATVPFSALYERLAAQITKKEGSVLLLYAVLHGCPYFHEYCLVRSDLDTMLLPLLELLYNAGSRTPNQLYMLLIILLIFSQDTAFAQNVHRVNVSSVPFYKERNVTNTTLGSLLVVLLLRTAHYNLAKLRDVYLHTNTLAALANLAPHMIGLSAHAAQRLLSLFHLLSRRYAKLQEEDAKASEQAAAGQTIDLQEAERRALEIQLYGDFLRIVLEIVNSILVNALPSNPELVYALLHRQELLLPFKDHPQFSELMANVTLVTEYFGRKVEESLGDKPTGDVSAESVLQIVKISSRGWRKDRLRAFPELRFTYEEETTAEEFFVPYVWSVIVSAVDHVPWDLQAIALFTPSVETNESAGDEVSTLSPVQPRRTATPDVSPEKTGGNLV